MLWFHDCWGNNEVFLCRHFSLRLHFLELSANSLSNSVMAAMTPPSSSQVMGVLGCFAKRMFPTCLRGQQCVLPISELRWKSREKTPSLQLCLAIFSWNCIVSSPWPPPKETDHLWVSAYFSRQDKYKSIDKGNSGMQGDNKCQATLACRWEVDQCIFSLLFMILTFLQKCLHLFWV